ncbi:programmed cell death 1 ligand 1-like isoform X2 [Xiphophorus maculatus]|uniref:programmed cell death 1 ligand 1-like isoform X2 n=1 Tax=Xiphophorus maculatus TaxID=8083 RepID=UPI000C6C9231|nr:programmed cell death 1 ligand 1-like isoform X2 [Xiphophorus maculatus]
MISRVFLAGWLTVWVFCFSIAEGKVEYKVIGPSMPVTAEEKDDVVLQCHVEPELDVTNETVEWKLQDKLVYRYRSRTDDPDFQDPKFKGRTSLFLKEMVQGNVSLKLTNITEEDAGNYTCKVLKRKAQVTLNVGKVDPGHQEEDLEKVSTVKSGHRIYVVTIVIFIVVAGGFFLWKCTVRNETAGQSQEHESKVLPGPGSDAEPRGSPLRHRSSGNSTTSPT